MTEGTIATVILAAGGSRRLGRAKQLVLWHGRTLIRHAAETALAAALGPIAVVLGARREDLERELAGLCLEIVHNPRWEDGIGGSIGCGVEHVRRARSAAVLLMLSDQPQLTAAHLRALAVARATANRPIAASSYASGRGVPALFRSDLFVELEALGGDVGAKDVIRRDPSRVVSVPFPRGEDDVDTPGDLARLRLD